MKVEMSWQPERHVRLNAKSRKCCVVIRHLRRRYSCGSFGAAPRRRTRRRRHEQRHVSLRSQLGFYGSGMSGTELNLQHPTKEEPWRWTDMPARQRWPFARAFRTASPGWRRARRSSRATCFVSFGASSIRRISYLFLVNICVSVSRRALHRYRPTGDHMCGRGAMGGTTYGSHG